MCCLFGLIDYKHHFSGKQKSKMLHALATASEIRGTDATGIAYNASEKLIIHKNPIPGHKMVFYARNDTTAAMGHTRMTTQGTEHKNRNNHPFYGNANGSRFALAHNGMIYNDKTLRQSFSLPATKIETDSFIGVQLIEKMGVLNFSSLKFMAEQLLGTFTFTILDSQDNLYIVKGDNPFCLLRYPSLGLYLYASTSEVLQKALKHMELPAEKPIKIQICCGEIVRIDKAGKIKRSEFDDTNLCRWDIPICTPYLCSQGKPRKSAAAECGYLDSLKSVASAFGYTSETVDRLVNHGFMPEEIEEFLYEGGL